MPIFEQQPDEPVIRVPRAFDGTQDDIDNAPTFTKAVGLLWQTLPLSEFASDMDQIEAIKEFGIDEDFDWWNSSDPYLRSQYPEELYDSKNIQELQLREQNIRQNLNAKQEIDKLHPFKKFLVWGTSLAQDPLILFNPYKKVEWGGNIMRNLGKNFLSSGTRTAGLVAPWEVARVNMDPTADPEKELPLVLGGSFLLGGALSPIFAKLKSRAKTKEEKLAIQNEIDEVLDEAMDEVDNYITKGTREPVVKASLDRTKDQKYFDIDVDPNREVILRGPKDDTTRAKASGIIRNVFKYPLGLSRSWYDENLDIANVLAKDELITRTSAKELIDITHGLSGDFSYLVNRNVDEGIEASVNTKAKTNWNGEIQNIFQVQKELYASLNNISLSKNDVGSLGGTYDSAVQSSRVLDFFKRGLNKVPLLKNKINTELFTFKNVGHVITMESGMPAKSAKEFLSEYRKVIPGLTKLSDEELEKVFQTVQKSTVVNRSVYKRFGNELKRLGLLQNPEGLKKTIARLEKRLEIYKGREKLFDKSKTKYGPEVYEELKSLMNKVKNEIAYHKALLKEELNAPVRPPKNQEHYIPIVYDINAVRQYRTMIEDELAKTFAGPLKEARIRAKQTVDNILQEGDGQFQNVTGRNKGGSRYLMGRQIALPKRILAQITETDPMLLGRNYIAKMGARIEMAKFGDGDIMLGNIIDRVENIFMEAMSKAKSKKEFQKLQNIRVSMIQNIEDSRDTLLGTMVSSSQAGRWDSRLARGLKNAAAMAVAGKFAFNAVVDLNGLVRQYKWGPILKQAGQRLMRSKEYKELTLKVNRPMLQRFDVINEMAMGSVSKRYIAENGAYPVVGKYLGPLEHLLDKGGGAIHKVSGLGALTVYMKEFAGNLAIQSFVTRAIKISNSIKVVNGRRTLPTKELVDDLDNFQALGFSLDDIIAIGKKEKGVTWKEVTINNQKLYEVDPDTWVGKSGEKLAKKWGYAINSEVKMTIMTPELAQLPGQMLGFWRSAMPDYRSGANRRWKSKRIKLEKKLSKVSDELSKAYKRKDKVKIEELTDEFRTIQRDVSINARYYMPLVSMSFQFFNFGVGAAQKILGPYVQGRGPGIKSGLATAGALSYLMLNMKYDWFHEQPIDYQIAKTLEYAGVTSWMFNADTMIDGVSAMFMDNDESLGIYNFVNSPFDNDQVDKIRRIGGTPYHIPYNAYELLFNRDNMNERDVGKAIRTMIPFNNVPFIEDLYKGTEEFIRENN